MGDLVDQLEAITRDHRPTRVKWALLVLSAVSTVFFGVPVFLHQMEYILDFWF